MEHYLEFEYPKGIVEVYYQNKLIAKSNHTVLLKEIGGLGYNEVYYFNKSAVDFSDIIKNEYNMHCYLKGESSFWTLGHHQRSIWEYENTYIEANPLKGRVAFDPKVFEVRSA